MIKLNNDNNENLLCKYNEKELIFSSRQRRTFNTIFKKPDNENFQYFLQNLKKLNTLKHPDKLSEKVFNPYTTFSS